MEEEGEEEESRSTVYLGRERAEDWTADLASADAFPDGRHVIFSATL